MTSRNDAFANDGISAAQHRVLYVVAKKPEAGHTKTRLCPPLHSEEAADLYAAFLADTLSIMRRVAQVRRGIAYLPAGGETFFSALAPDMELISQQGESLGERLDYLITQALEDGADQVVVMDSDSPTLPPHYIAQAYELLDGDADAVFGPCRDGGYYLVGAKRPLSAMLREVRMSTPTVLADTLAIAEREGVRVRLLPEWYDVDTGEELAQLAVDLQTAEGTAAEHTRRTLAAMMEPLTRGRITA